ncbi:MAG: phosphate signaling complex protein PhoU [Deltaproteobacteria bacterium]|nr:phosphate signaling complex protein PhoU [Deltaproteobacteria bacterium]
MNPEQPDFLERHKGKLGQDLENLTGQLLRLAELAKKALEDSLEALWRRDPELARQVMAGDKAINDLEEEIDINCVRIIALYQPVAVDLRQIMAVDHLIAELERIGDLAVNIAEEALNVSRMAPREFHPDLPRMARMVLNMLERSLTAFINHDVKLAREVCLADDEVDSLDRSIVHELVEEMAKNEAIPFGHSQLNVVRNLERAGDHATNIAEQVVYMVEGESVRHRCQA